MTTLRINTLFAAAGNFSMTLSLAVAIVVVARFGDPELVGRYGYALSICAPIFLLAHLRLRDVRGTQANNKHSLDDYFRITFVTNVIAIALVAPVCLLVGVDLQTVMIAIMIGLWKVSISFSDLVYGYHQRNANLKAVARLQILHGIATVVTFSSVFISTRNLPLTLGVLFPINMLLLFAVDIPSLAGDWGTIPKSVDHNRRQRLWNLAWTALPLGLAGAIFSLNMVIPRGFLEHHFSLAEVGVFSTLAFFARAGTPVMQALGQASSRQLAETVKSGDSKRFSKILWKATSIPLLLGTVAVALGWLVGQEVIAFVYGPDYVTSKGAIALITVYATLVYVSTVLTYGVIAARRLKSQLVVLSITVLSVLISGAILIPPHGIMGACGCLAISAGVRIIGTVAINIQAVQSMSPAHLKAV